VEKFRGHDRRSIKKKEVARWNKNVLNENVSKVEQKVGRQFASKQMASHRPNLFRPSCFLSDAALRRRMPAICGHRDSANSIPRDSRAG
jgi:hypothetical protein